MTLAPSSTPTKPPLGLGSVSDHSSRVWLYLLLGWVLWALGAWFLGDSPALSGEPAWLRWCRACAEHPVRTPLGLGLLVHGLATLTRLSEEAGLGLGERL